MNDGDALLATILADRADDTARLVYADWLEENGDPRRAEYIRACIKLWNMQKETQTPEHTALARRIKELLDENPLDPGWREPWPGARLDPAVGMYSQRGFWGTLVCPAAAWAANGDRLLTWSPVEKVFLTNRPAFYWHGSFAVLEDDPHKRYLDSSCLTGRCDGIKELCEHRWKGVSFDVPVTASPLVNWMAGEDAPDVTAALSAAILNILAATGGH